VKVKGEVYFLNMQQEVVAVFGAAVRLIEAQTIPTAQ
jgi:hypothetical protein